MGMRRRKTTKRMRKSGTHRAHKGTSRKGTHRKKK